MNGDWVVEVVGSSGSPDNPDGEVCEVLTLDGYKRIAEHVSSEHAFLIAAAPGLLRTLAMMVDYHTLPAKEYEGKYPNHVAQHDLVTAARSAIAKARGQ